MDPFDCQTLILIFKICFSILFDEPLILLFYEPLVIAV